jgi:hypothetical protein
MYEYCAEKQKYSYAVIRTEFGNPKIFVPGTSK